MNSDRREVDPLRMPGFGACRDKYELGFNARPGRRGAYRMRPFDHRVVVAVRDAVAFKILPDPVCFTVPDGIGA